MRYVQADLPQGVETYELSIISDWHKGHPCADDDVILDELGYVADDPLRRGFVLAGDLAEMATKNQRHAGVYEQILSPHDQFREIKRLLRPFARLCKGAVPGNHEKHLQEFRLTEELCEDLGIPYLGAQGVVGLVSNKCCHTVHLWHGIGGGGMDGTALNRAVGMAKMVQASVHAMGHYHRRIALPKEIYIPDPRNRKMMHREEWYIVNGSALRWENTYAEHTGLSPCAVGMVRVRFRFDRLNRQIEVKL